MQTLEAIYTRQSNDKIRPDPVPRELIEQLLAAAVQAPNHYKVRPWRFFVLSGAARERLGDLMAGLLAQAHPELDETALAVERHKPLRAPVLIVVAADLPAEPRVLEIENICAAAAAAQNLLLAAQELGLAARWRTGPAAYDPAVKAFFGLLPEQPLIAMIYVGYPEMLKPPVTRPGFEDRTVWMDV